MIPAENVGVKHAKWDKEAGFQTFRECYNSYFYIVEDKSLNVVDKFRLHGRRYIKHLTGGSALHMNLEEHLSKEQYRQLLRVAAIEGCNYFTFNIPNTICNECKHIDKRYLHECPECHSRNVDYLTRVIGYMKRISNFFSGKAEGGCTKILCSVTLIMTSYFKKFRMKSLWRSISLTVPIGARAVIALICWKM